jgi:hypothetical protein
MGPRVIPIPSGLHGVVDHDFFDWVLEVLGGEGFIATLARRLARFGHRVGQLAAQFFWGGLVGKLIDQRMLYGRQPAAHPLAALQQRQPLPGGQRLEVQPEHPFDSGVQGIESCRDRVSIHNSARTHTVKLAWATDKNTARKPLKPQWRK